MSRFTRWSAVLGVVLAVSGAAHATPMLANGSFEQNLTGWTKTGAVGVVTNQGQTDGVRAVNFNGGNNPPGSANTLFQTVNTVVGQKYYVEFDFRKYGTATGTAALDSRIINVANSALLANLAVSDTAGAGGGSLTADYTTYDYSFNAAGAATRLTFVDQSVGTVSFDPMLDRTSLNVIRNGSFEQGLTGWTSSGTVGVTGIDAGGFQYGASNGLNALGFNGGQQTTAAVVSQTFDTLAGQEYAVEFDFRKWGFATGTASLLANIVDGANNAVLASVNVSDSVGDQTNNANNTNYSHYYFKFFATGSQTKIQFFDQSTNRGFSFDPVLDNVIVSTIPEPTTAALAVLGLSALGLGRRRR